MMLLDALLPPCCFGCGVLLRRHATLELCSRCVVSTAPLPDAWRHVDGITARFAYDGVFADALVRCKYGGDSALAGALGRAIARDPLWSVDGAGHSWDLVTCVPMHTWRRVRRGFDHAALMLRHAHREVPRGRACPALLVRVRNDPPQATLPASARRLNLRGAFAVARTAPPLRGARVLVVDDVTTTGATLHEAVAVLLAAGAASAHGLALLRTLPA